MALKQIYFPYKAGKWLGCCLVRKQAPFFLLLPFSSALQELAPKAAPVNSFAKQVLLKAAVLEA